ncbi:LamG-like jellyroll fold domain-containing protein [Streptomyces sp. NPDC002640]
MVGGALLAVLPVPAAPAAAQEPRGDGSAAVTEDVRAQRRAVAAGERVEVTGRRAPGERVYANPDGRTFTAELTVPGARTGVDAAGRTVLSSDGGAIREGQPAPDGLGVGLCGSGTPAGTPAGTPVPCTTGEPFASRVWFRFPGGALAGKEILDAAFRITGTGPLSCEPRWVELHHTGEVAADAVWPGPGGPTPGDSSDLLTDRKVPAKADQECGSRFLMEFHDAADEPDENLTAAVRSAADDGEGSLTLMLKAKDETDPTARQRFDDTALLSVTYVSRPAPPTATGLWSMRGAVCAESPAEPTPVGGTTPHLTATPRAEEGGAIGADLRIRFDLEVRGEDGSWTPAAPTGEDVLVPSTGYQSDGVPVTHTWRTKLAEGPLHRFRAATVSYRQGDGSSLVGEPTGWCHFTVDALAPRKPEVVFDSVYSACLPDSCVFAGRPGLPGRVTFRPAEGDVNTGYTYRLATDPSWSTVSGNTATVSIVPDSSGTALLSVRARDAAGRTGSETTVRFLVGAAAGPVGRWTFHEESGDAADVSATAPDDRDDAALHGGATRDDHGRRGTVTENGATGEDRALRLDGGSAYAATGSAVLDTAGSYTVAAWARPESGTGTVLAQDGTEQSPFRLGLCAGTGTWCLTMTDADASGAQTLRLDSGRPAAVGAWTHLAAVVDRDAGSGTVTLYVNGVARDSRQLEAGWSAGGPLQIGRSLVDGSHGEYFAGDIDEVAVWQEPKPASGVGEEARLAARDSAGAHVEQVARFAPADAEAGAASLADASGYGNDLALAGGAAPDGEGLLLGAEGEARASGPVVDGTGSFTLGARVDLSAEAIAAMPVGHRARVAGDGGWALWFERTGSVEEPVLDENGDLIFDPETGDIMFRQVPVGHWSFGRPGAAAHGDTVTTVGTDVTLVGIHDAVDATVELYVNGVRQSGSGYEARPSSGVLTVGGPVADTASTGSFPGRITDLAVWAGAVNGAHQVEEVFGS